MDTTPQGSTPVPDPTALTTAAVDRAGDVWRRELNSAIENVMTRISAMDLATEVRLDTFRALVEHQREYLLSELNVIATIATERFAAIETQFKERDTRSERESRDNKLAVDAAFAAQEKQASAQNEGNQLAIAKSEKATAETIKTNADLTRVSLDAVNAVTSDMKDRLVSLEQRKIGWSEQQSEHRTGQTQNISAIVAVFSGISLLISLVGMFIALRQ